MNLHELLPRASIYVVRKIRASISDGEQQEKPIITPCSAIAQMTQPSKSNAPLVLLGSIPNDDIIGGAGPGLSSETAVQKCGS